MFEMISVNTILCERMFSKRILVKEFSERIGEGTDERTGKRMKEAGRKYKSKIEVILGKMKLRNIANLLDFWHFGLYYEK